MRVCGKDIIFIIKQDIRIYVTNSRPNGGTGWAEIFLREPMTTLGITKAKQNLISNFFHS